MSTSGLTIRTSLQKMLRSNVFGIPCQKYSGTTAISTTTDARDTKLSLVTPSMEAPMDCKQLHILQHSLGLDEHGRGTMYRSHFVTGEGSKDHADCMALVEAGY